jgi:stage II sporulation protein R
MVRINVETFIHERGFKMKLRKKHIGFILFGLLALLLYGFHMQGSRGDLLTNDDFIRFHVIANSDTLEDQNLKLKVRDELLELINEKIVIETMAKAEPDNCSAVLNIDRTKEFINSNLAELELAAGGIISDSGYRYPVKAELGVDYIPKKTYGNITFPAGCYNALKITIGEGKGENWWCVLFPPLCLIDGQSEESTGGLYEEAILNEKYKFLIEDSETPKTLKLRFKVLEIIKNVKST